MPRYLLIAILAISYVTSFCQSPKVARSPSEAVALLAKTKALYDTPFRAGLINFDCAIDVDFDQYLKSNFGKAARTDSPLAQLLKPIRYRVFVDRSGATVSAQPKLPDFSQLPLASQLEESNRDLMQMGLTNWVPYAYGEVLPVGPTNYQFEKTITGYNLSMDGLEITGKLTDFSIHLAGDLYRTPAEVAGLVPGSRLVISDASPSLLPLCAFIRTKSCRLANLRFSKL
ncbi:hypothetical protein [Granulicella mallensis]|uniref:Uncharacterized protein n=1 Tax=Granulicella mallensis (strain ATCC BAA-1857 / DSM 23137 / MP5ACTX8) TaxID=682795 RepID=G8NWB2_GRAMM|nr:hypothetical protein [Granulicella mallensis]AEU36624.1 hypothetical protein AciX8_2307 [Granulicella mallensis MP5ACTX8]